MAPTKSSGNSKKNGCTNNVNMVSNPFNTKSSTTSVQSKNLMQGAMTNKKGTILFVPTDRNTNSMNPAQSSMTMAKRLQKNAYSKPSKPKSSSNKVSTFVSSSTAKSQPVRQSSKATISPLPKQQNKAVIVPFSSNFISQVQQNTWSFHQCNDNSYSKENSNILEISGSFFEMIRFINE